MAHESKTFDGTRLNSSSTVKVSSVCAASVTFNASGVFAPFSRTNESTRRVVKRVKGALNFPLRHIPARSIERWRISSARRRVRRRQKGASRRCFCTVALHQTAA